VLAPQPEGCGSTRDGWRKRSGDLAEQMDAVESVVGKATGRKVKARRYPMARLSYVAGVLLLFAVTTAPRGGEAGLNVDRTANIAPAAQHGDALERLAAFGQPGEPHRQLAARAGSWNVEIFYIATPDGDPMYKMTGSSDVQVLWDGRYVQETFQTTVNGQAVEVRTITTFDNRTKEYVATWIDSVGTGILVAKGKHHGTGRTINYSVDLPKADGPSTKKIRVIEDWTGADTRRLWVFYSGPDGREFMTLDLVLTRQHGGTGASSAR
jgi:hypothetical protein